MTTSQLSDAGWARLCLTRGTQWSLLIRIYCSAAIAFVVLAYAGAEREPMPLCDYWLRSDQQGGGNGPDVQEARHQRCSQGLQVVIVVLVVDVVFVVRVVGV